MTDSLGTPGPTSHSYYSQRLRLHYVDWGNAAAPPMLLVHGGRDHCRNWDWVAQHFYRDYHIIAPDLRGHGDSQWILGGSYTIPEYVYDIAQLIHQKNFTPVTILAHSLGGMISLHYSGIYPEFVKKLVVIEGTGTPPERLAARDALAPQRRLDDWTQALRKLSGRMPRRYENLEQAYQRMHDENPHLSPAQARHLTIHGSSQNEDGTYSWKFDNYVRVFAPMGVTTEDTIALWRRISCPTLLVRGTESWASDPQKDGRAKYFQDVTCVNFENAGHWVHHDQLDAFVARVKAFLAE